MIYTAKIEVFEDPKKLVKCFGPELKKEKADRSSFTIKKKSKSLIFDIKAKDSVALRATLNSITKLCTVYEKIHELK